VTLAYSNHSDKYQGVDVNQKKKCQYVLKELELSLSQADDFICPRFTIEHIKNDSEGGNACFIGNMIPLTSSANKNLKNKLVEEKIPKYKSVSYASTKQVAVDIEKNKIENDIYWNDNSIEQRNSKLAKNFYKSIWINKITY